MKRFELSLSKDYVPGWNIENAIRELFQNAIDQETANMDNAMGYSFVADEDCDDQGTLYISNPYSVLDTSSLLLGGSTKTNDENSIGQFGEGYKIATLVLLRNNKKVIFHNNSKNQIWTPKFVKSRRYGAEILTFMVENVPTTAEGLIIEIQGITTAEWEDISCSNLHIQGVYESISTDIGEILLEERHAGKVYVNGLFVCDYDKYVYGYNFHPKHLRLDRDRKLVSDWDLSWLASKMWVINRNKEMNDLMVTLLQQNAADVLYAANHLRIQQSSKENGIEAIADSAGSSFYAQHGRNAVPVSSQSEVDELAPGQKPVIVSENYKEVIQQSTTYKKPKIIQKKTFVQEVREWFDGYNPPSEDLEYFKKLETLIIAAEMEESS